MAPADREAFLAEPRIGVLTIARDGAQPPLASPIWYEYVPGGDVVINVGRGSVKARLATAAGAASLTVQTEQLPYRFVTVGGPLTIDRRRRRHPPAHRCPLPARPRWSTSTSPPPTPTTW